MQKVLFPEDIEFALILEFADDLFFQKVFKVLDFRDLKCFIDEKSDIFIT